MYKEQKQQQSVFDRKQSVCDQPQPTFHPNPGVCSAHSMDAPDEDHEVACKTGHTKEVEKLGGNENAKLGIEACVEVVYAAAAENESASAREASEESAKAKKAAGESARAREAAKGPLP